MSQRSRSKSRRKGTSGEEKWKTKVWYTIKTPSYLDDKVIGTTPANDPEHLLGRTVYTSLMDITGDFKDMNVLLKFKIVDVQGEFARTDFYGYYLSRDFIRAQIRNHISTIEAIENFEFKDGAKIRARLLCITTNRANSSQKKALRKHMINRLHEFSNDLTYQTFVTKLLNKEVKEYIAEGANKIYPIKILDIAKIKVLQLPTE